MALPPVPTVGAAGAISPTTSQVAKESFAKVASEVGGPGASAKISGPPRELAPQPVRATAGQTSAQCADGAARVGRTEAVAGVDRAEATRVADRVLAAQQKLDKVLELAESGKTFSTTELIALQAHVYSASQELDLAGKVVEKATSGLKTLLQTQL